jgi:hypothetical protein
MESVALATRSPDFGRHVDQGDDVLDTHDPGDEAVQWSFFIYPAYLVHKDAAIQMYKKAVRSYTLFW